MANGKRTAGSCEYLADSVSYFSAGDKPAGNPPTFRWEFNAEEYLGARPEVPMVPELAKDADDATKEAHQQTRLEAEDAAEEARRWEFAAQTLGWAVYNRASQNVSSLSGLGRVKAQLIEARRIWNAASLEKEKTERETKVYQDSNLVEALMEWRTISEADANKLYLKNVTYRGGKEYLKKAEQLSFIEALLKKYDDLRAIYQRKVDEATAAREAAQDLEDVDEL